MELKFSNLKHKKQQIESQESPPDREFEDLNSNILSARG